MNREQISKYKNIQLFGGLIAVAAPSYTFCLLASGTFGPGDGAMGFIGFVAGASVMMFGRLREWQSQ